MSADIANFLMSSQRDNTRMAVAMAMIKQKQTQDQSLLNILGEGLLTGEALQAAAPPGQGQIVDKTA
jgi:hypothetical protein